LGKLHGIFHIILLYPALDKHEPITLASLSCNHQQQKVVTTVTTLLMPSISLNATCGQ